MIWARSPTTLEDGATLGISPNKALVSSYFFFISGHFFFNLPLESRECALPTIPESCPDLKGAQREHKFYQYILSSPKASGSNLVPIFVP